MGTNEAGAEPTTEEAIMRATYRALEKHGYAALTMQSIADEFDKTKAVIHYHYDTKAKLLVAFLDYLLDRFARDIDAAGDAPADERLLAILGQLLGRRDGPTDDEFDHRGLTIALLQIHAQAPFDPAYREQLSINVDTVRDLLAGVIRDGIDRGTFREVDPDRTAATLLACALGARIHAVTLDRPEVEGAVARTVDDLVTGWLRRPEGE